MRTVKLKNSQIRDSINAISRLDGYIFKTGRTHYNLAKQLKILTGAYETVESTEKVLRVGIDGNPKAVREYAAKITEMLEIEVELDRVYKVPMSEMLEARIRDPGGIQPASIPVQSLKDLDWMIEDDLELPPKAS